jgi:hypothetical protein
LSDQIPVYRPTVEAPKVADVNGRAYAKLSSLKAGDIVQVDGDFTCIGKWQERPVEHDGEREGPQGLYIKCRSGRHYLDGQADDGDTLIGVYGKG